jgi:membrane-bound ClpP family serine protease
MMDSMWLFLAVFLYLLSAVLLIAEVFVPSGGVISIFSLICLGGGLTIFFKHSTAAAVVGVIIALIMIPSVLIVAYKMFPNTRFGKAVTLEPPKREKGDAIPDTAQLKGLVGETGVVVSPLRPVGMVEFSGKRIECVAESGYIEIDTKVQVIETEGTQLTVREIK